MTSYDIEVEEYGIDDDDDLYCILSGARYVAGPFGSREEAEKALAKITDEPNGDDSEAT